MPKRLVDGKLYDTDTAKLIASRDYVITRTVRNPFGPDTEEDDKREQIKLFCTAGGVFFLFSQKFDRFQKGIEDEVGIRTYVYAWREKPSILEFKPLANRKAAEEWITTGEVTLEDTSIFAEPDEATTEKATATLYLRIPQDLKTEIELITKTSKRTINAWAIGCLEHCVERVKARNNNGNR